MDIYNASKLTLSCCPIARNSLGVMPVTCLNCEDRCAGESEYLQIPEEMDNILMALSKMTAVALIKNNNTMFVKDFMPFILRDKVI